MRTLTVFCILLYALTNSAEPIPLWKFFEPFDMNQVRVSPQGTYLAASLLVGDGAEQENKFQIIERKTGERVLSFAMPEKQRVSSITWNDDETVLISTAVKVPNEEAYVPRGQLMKVLVKTSKTIDLPSGGIFDMLIDDPDHVLVVRLEGRYAEIHKMHLQSGALMKIARAPALGFGFILTPDLQDVAFHVGQNDDLETLVHERTLEGGGWELRTVTSYDRSGWEPIGHAFKSDEYFTLDRRNDKGIAALGIYNRKTREHSEVFLDDTYDVSNTLSDLGRNVWGLMINHHYPRVMYLNPKHPLAQHHKTIRRYFPESTVTLESYTHDHQLVVARVSSATALPELVLSDANEGSVNQITNRAEEIGISSQDLSSMEPFWYTTRDKKTVYGYLTSRKDTPKPGPMVVHVHGGPLNVRDSWFFDPVGQILASRGYHVLQVNFRGSGGFGVRFRNAGFLEYGGKMQDDVTDATLWAIEQGIADEDRICITGGSYGAYAAVMGAAKEPELYQCVIGQSGIYDIAAIERLGDLSHRKSSIKWMRLTMGRTREAREAVSAIHVAGDVKAPVMLIHGGQDRRTPPEHYHRMKEAFDRAGKSVVTYYKSNQGHGWIGRDTVMDLYNRQLAFLNEHIGSGIEQTQHASIAH